MPVKRKAVKHVPPGNQSAFNLVESLLARVRTTEGLRDAIDGITEIEAIKLESDMEYLIEEWQHCQQP